MSKGSKRRPSNVSVEEYAHNYDKIFKGIEPEIPTAAQVECTAIVKYVPPDLTKMDHPTACKYLVEGMSVKVLRRADNFEANWNNCWVSGMDNHIGEIHEIKSLCGLTGVELKTAGGRFPAFCLQIIEPGQENINGS